MITDSNNCSRLSDGFVITTISPASILQGTGEIEIYPNPVGTKLTIRGLRLEMGIVTLDIYNVLGEEVRSLQSDLSRSFREIKNLPKGSGQAKSEIDISSLSKGLYWIQISDGEKVYRAKIIKQ